MFHRIDDPEALTPQRLIDFAVRLPAYAGIVAARIRTEQEATQQMNGGGQVDGMRFVDASSVNLATDPVFSDLFEVD